MLAASSCPPTARQRGADPMLCPICVHNIETFSYKVCLYPNQQKLPSPHLLRLFRRSVFTWPLHSLVSGQESCLTIAAGHDESGHMNVF